MINLQYQTGQCNGRAPIVIGIDLARNVFVAHGVKIKWGNGNKNTTVAEKLGSAALC